MRTKFALLAMVSTLCALLASFAAFAMVQPPQEWLDESEANRRTWDEMRPQLQKWTAGEVEDWRLPEPQALLSIDSHFGDTREVRTVSLNDPELRFAQLDLNFDGVVDQFDVLELGYQAEPRKTASIANSKGTVNLIIVRCEFSDVEADEAWDYDYTYDLMLADGTGDNPSFHDYYEEVSYGDLDIEGTVDDEGPNNGWYTAPNTKNYYKNNIMELLLYAAESIDEHTDFSDYDADGDGYADSFILFYPETEFVGGLWPHMSSGMNYYADGVIVDVHYVSGFGGAFTDSYNMCCAAHEYGHIMGAVDLYDTDYTSRGVGKWSLMAYNYDSSFKPPAFDPWHRMQYGWITPLVITEDTASLDILQIETNRFALKLWTNGDPGDEYFLVENREKTGTDATRPGEGLMIYHCDDSRSSNTNDSHRLVDVECATGLDGNNKDHLDYDDGSQGEPDDPFFSGNNDTFNFTSNPPSKSYAGSDSYVKVENISASGSTMTADISVETGTHPTVSITAPSEDDTVSGDVAFSADATADGSRTISKVDFYANGYFVGSDDTGSSDSYEITWNSRTCYNTTVYIAAKATDSEGETYTDTIEVTVDNSGEWPFSDSMDNTWNWAIYDPSGNAYWELKTSTYISSPSCLGIGTGYDYNEHDRILSPLLDLTSTTEPTLGFYVRYRVSNSMDNVRVYVISEDGSDETQVKSYTGNDLSWKSHAVYLDDWVGERVFVAFELNSTSLSHDSGGGAWVDDVELNERSDPPSINSVTPNDGATVSDDVLIEVDASDDEEVTYVAFWMSGDYVGSDTSEPFQFSWNSRDAFNGDVDVLVRAYDADEQYDEVELTYTVDNTPFTPSYVCDFEDSDHFNDNWRIVDASGPGTWQLTNYSYYRGTHSAYCGQIGTHQYGAYEYDWLITPTVDLTSVLDPFLYFHHKYGTESGYDYVKIYATTDLQAWDLLGQFDGTGGWQVADYDLSSYGQPVKIAFLLQSDPLVVGEGWYLDDVMVRPFPEIDSVMPSRLSVGETTAISGSGFGGGHYPGALVLPGHGAVTAGEVTSWDDDEIVLDVPGDTVSGTIHMWGQDTGAAITIVLPPPTLEGLEQY